MPAPRNAGEEGLRDQLRKLLNPLDVMVITREKLQDVLEDAVQRGRMTRDDARDLLGELMRRGEDVVAMLDTPRRTLTGADAFPIGGYDELTAAQVVALLNDLDARQLRAVRDYERRNANRKTVLSAVEQRLTP
jgi:hypothetical protein